MLAESFVEFPNPAFALRLQEIGVQTAENAIEPEGPHPHLVLENAAQLVGAPCRHLVGKPLGATGVFEEGGQLFRPEEVAEPPGACHAGALPRHEAAAEARQERLPAERRRDRLAEGGKQSAVGQSVAVERQRPERRRVEQVVIAQPAKRTRQDFGGRRDEAFVPRVADRHVVPRQRGSERALHPKSKTRREGRGEEREERRVSLRHRLRTAFLAESEGHFHVALDALRRARHRPGEHQPGLFGLPVAFGLPHQFHSPHSVVRRVGLAQVEARGAVRDPPLDLLDLAKEKESAGSEAPHRLPDLAGVGESPEREHEKRLVRGTRDRRGRRDRQHVVLKGEILPARMHFGPVGEGVHRLEADAEATDLGEPRILGALPNAGDAPHVGFVEGKAEMADPQLTSSRHHSAGRRCLFRGPVARDAGLEAPTGRTGGVPGADVELDGARTGPVLPPRERVLCVLQEFVDEVGAVAVTMRQQLVSVVPDPRPVAAFVLAVDRPVVGGHCLSHNEISRTTISASPAGPGTAPSSQRTWRPRRRSSS